MRGSKSAWKKLVVSPKEVKIDMRVIVSVLVSFMLLTLLVQNYWHQRETDQRLTEMQEIVRVSASNSPTASTGVIANIHERGPVDDAGGRGDLEEVLDRGWKLVNQRSPERARRAVLLFEDGIAENPANADLYNGLGRALLISGKPSEAVAAWRKGLSLASNLSDMQSGIGWAYWCLNDPYRAKDAWERALVMNPHSPDAWSAMAWIDLALGKPAEAKRGFEELVKFDPGRKSWVMGLSMAQGHNTNLSQVTQFFSLPALEVFQRPLPIDPALVDAADVSRP